MNFAFSKYEGAGNDFIIIDDRALDFPLHERGLIQELCHRQKGIGADGIILLQESHFADFRMRIFNCDGSEPKMCGNGLRCLVHFIEENLIKETPFNIETGYGVHLCKNENFVSLGKPSGISQTKDIYLVDTGVPHAVQFLDHLEIDVTSEGRPLRHENNANVNFACLKDDVISVRTYERGVEAETLACGTGAAAVAYIAHKHHQVSNPVSILTKSGEILTVLCEEELFLKGPVNLVFKGVYLCKSS